MKTLGKKSILHYTVINNDVQHRNVWRNDANMYDKCGFEIKLFLHPSFCFCM